MKSWFVAYCAFRLEFRAEDVLRERGFEAYCPREIMFERRRGRRFKVTYPLLPRYLFVGLEAIRHGPGGKPEFPFDEVEAPEEVIGVLRVLGAPIEVPYDAPDPETTRIERGAGPRFLPVGWFRAMEEAGLFDHTCKVRRTPKKDEAVDIVGGQFQGFPAKFLELKGEDRVRIMMETMGRWSATTIKAEQVSWPDEDPAPKKGRAA